MTKLNYTIETQDQDGFVSWMEGFAENSTVYETLEEAKEAFAEAIEYAKNQGWCKDYIDSIHISSFETDEEE